MESHIAKLITSIPELSTETWEKWSWDIESALTLGGVWNIVLKKDDTTKKRPERPQPVKSSQPTSEEIKEQAAWDAANLLAAGWIRHAAGITHREITQAQGATASNMLDELEALYARKTGGARFDAWTELLAIRKSDTETFPDLVKRIDAAAYRLDSLRPAGWSLAKETNEIKTFVMLNAIPSNHTLYGSLTAQPTSLTYDNVKAAFLICKTPTAGISETASFAGSRPSTMCLFCRNSGHTVDVCNNMRYYQKIYLEERAKRVTQGTPTRGNRGRGTRGGRGGASSFNHHHANAAQVIEEVPEPNHSTEYAGNASLLLPEHSSAGANDYWVADTGASCHMTSRREWLTDFSECHVTVELADGSVILGTGRGSVSFTPYINRHPSSPIILSNVLYVPTLHNNLFSIFYFTMSNKIKMEVEYNQMVFMRNNRTVLTATRGARNVALLDGITNTPVKALFSANSSGATLERWHKRFNHSHYGAIKLLNKSDAIKDFKLVSGPPPPGVCVQCVEGKQHRASHTLPAERATRPLERVFSDVHGALPVMTRHGYHYWVSFIDDKSRLAAVYFLKNKSETFDAFKRYKAWAEKKLEKNIKILRDDKGGEYMSTAFNNFCDEQGIEREHTIRDTPQQNGVAERFNRTLAEGITTMLIQAKLPPSMWADAASTFVHTHNRLPSPNTNNRTPYELFCGKVPSISQLRTFGCLAHVHKQKDQREQLAPHTRKCIFIGYTASYKGWLFWDPDSRTEVISDSAVFDEDTFPGSIRNPIAAQTTPVTIDTFLPSFAPTTTPGLAPLPVREPEAPVRPEFPANNGLDDTLADDAPADNAAVDRRPAGDPPVMPVPALLFRAPAGPQAGHAVPLTRSGDGVDREVRTNHEVRRITDRTYFENHPGPIQGKRASKAREHPERLVESSDEETAALVIEGLLGEAERTELNVNEPSMIPSSSHVALTASTPTKPVQLPQKAPPFACLPDYVTIPIVDGVEFAFNTSTNVDPNTLEEALSRPDGEKWLEAAMKEIEAHLENGTWELVRLPHGKSAIGCRWVFKIKSIRKSEF